MSTSYEYFLNEPEDAGPQPADTVGALDCQGVPLRVGDKVAWSIGGRYNSGLSFGVVAEEALTTYKLMDYCVHFEHWDDPAIKFKYPPASWAEHDAARVYQSVKEWRWVPQSTRTKVHATRKGRKGVERSGSELIHYVEGEPIAPDN